MPSLASLARALPRSTTRSRPARRARLALALWLLALAPGAQAQAARYELGRRLSGLEEAWERADTSAKARALPSLQEAVRRFFGADPSEAARALESARLALEDLPRDGVEAWGASWLLAPDWRLGPRQEPPERLDFELRRAFELGTAPPAGSVFVIELVDARGDVLAGGVELDALAPAPRCASLELSSVPDGDHRLRATLRSRERSIARLQVGVSLLRDAGARLEALALARLEARDCPRLERASAYRLEQMLLGLDSGGVPEVDLPAARLLSLAQDWLTATEEDPRCDWRRAGEHWLQVPVGLRSYALRIDSPPCADDAPRPCVVAMHGAGGSDNLFFEGYGNGSAVRLARERGWVLVAPRSGLFGTPDVAAIVDALAGRYRIDPKRVALVGHSMGAALALRAARAQPSRFAALVLIGGGRPSAQDARMRAIPTWLATGSEDFAREGVQALAESLRALGATPHFELRVGIEHLTIVQESLPAAFAFLDEVLPGS